MKQALLFTWFPIVLAVGIGARLLGQARGFGLGALAALFWIVLVQAQGGVVIWHDPWQVSALAAGAFVLVMMGGWAGQSGLHTSGRLQDARTTEHAAALADEEAVRWKRITAAVEQFDDWLGRHVSEREPWPKLSEFIRGVLYECCQATHVKCLRFVEATQELRCLDDSDDLVQSVPPCTPLTAYTPVKGTNGGVIGRVFSTGQSFLAGSPLTSAETVKGESRTPESLGDSDENPLRRGERSPAWCFPIERGGARLGVVGVGQLGSTRPSRSFMAAMEKLISLFWLHVYEVNINRLAGDEDPVSGLLNRHTFLRTADARLRASYEQGEPVALAVVGVQGLRQLNDAGRWEVADELVREIGAVLRARARLDDCIGRFDGSRFIWLLRRVDSELADLILRHVMGRLEQVCNDSRWGIPAVAYCGFTGSRSGKPDLRRLVTAALQQSQRARMERVPLASDLSLDGARAAKQLAGANA